MGYTAAAGRDFSYLMLGVPGPGCCWAEAAAGAGLLIIRVAGLLAGGDPFQKGPFWFYDSHVVN